MYTSLISFVFWLHLPEDIDLVLESVSIGDGCCTEELVGGETTTYHFTYHIIKGDASGPAQLQYAAYISVDKDLGSPTTRLITQGNQTWQTSGGTTATCKSSTILLLLSENVYYVFWRSFEIA